MGISVFPAASAGYDQTKLTLRQTITSGTSVTIPADITQVYAILIGGGGGGSGGGGGAGVTGTNQNGSGAGGGGGGGASELET